MPTHTGQWPGVDEINLYFAVQLQFRLLGFCSSAQCSLIIMRLSELSEGLLNFYMQCHGTALMSEVLVYLVDITRYCQWCKSLDLTLFNLLLVVMFTTFVTHPQVKFLPSTIFFWFF